MDLSFFRSQPYFQRLEQTMQTLLQWRQEGQADGKTKPAVKAKGKDREKAANKSRRA